MEFLHDYQPIVYAILGTLATVFGIKVARAAYVASRIMFAFGLKRGFAITSGLVLVGAGVGVGYDILSYKTDITDQLQKAAEAKDPGEAQKAILNAIKSVEKRRDDHLLFQVDHSKSAEHQIDCLLATLTNLHDGLTYKVYTDDAAFKKWKDQAAKAADVLGQKPNHRLTIPHAADYTLLALSGFLGLLISGVTRAGRGNKTTVFSKASCCICQKNGEIYPLIDLGGKLMCGECVLTDYTRRLSQVNQGQNAKPAIKPGDKVRVLRNTCGAMAVNEHRVVEPGDVLTVNRIEGNNVYYLISYDQVLPLPHSRPIRGFLGRENYIPIADVELVDGVVNQVSANKPAIKPGDKVRVLRNTCTAFSPTAPIPLKAGEVLVVAEVQGDRILYHTCDGGTNYIPIADVELVKEDDSRREGNEFTAIKAFLKEKSEAIEQERQHLDAQKRLNEEERQAIQESRVYQDNLEKIRLQKLDEARTLAAENEAFKVRWQQRSQELDATARRLTTLETNIKSREDNLHRREASVGMREATVAQREERVAARETKHAV